MSLPADIVTAIAQTLSERIGLDLPAWVIEARATARIAALGCSADDYATLIHAGRGQGELDELVESVRVGETRLFRHRSQIAALADVIAPALKARGKRSVRVWCAGCSTGEEPYTLAAVLAEALPGVALSVVATDVSADALAIAAHGVYPPGALADVPERWRDFFLADDDGVRPRPDIADLVTFERANLVDGPAPRGCDLVWCRNVLIYFTPPARKRVVDKLLGALVTGGTIFVGYSESLRDLRELDPLRTGDAVYYVKRDPELGPREITGVHSIAGLSSATSADTKPLKPVARRVPDDAKTPPPMLVPRTPPTTDVLALRGRPEARAVTAELSVRLGLPGLRALIIDLDGAELLGDDLAPVIRRARAAAQAAQVTLTCRATRMGPLRWLARMGLDGDAS